MADPSPEELRAAVRTVRANNPGCYHPRIMFLCFEADGSETGFCTECPQLFTRPGRARAEPAVKVPSE